MDKLEVIERIENKYCTLSDNLKAELTTYGKLIQVTKGQILVHEEQKSTKLWYIVEGAARAIYTKDGKRICDWFAFENDFIFAITSFYSNKPSLHQIDMVSAGLLFEMDRDEISVLFFKYHEFERLGRLATTATMLRLQERIVAIQFETASKRLENLLTAHPDIYQRIPLGDIASYIGITQETLSRLRANHVRI